MLMAIFVPGYNILNTKCHEKQIHQSFFLFFLPFHSKQDHKSTKTQEVSECERIWEKEKH